MADSTEYRAVLGDSLSEAWSMPPSPSTTRFRQSYGYPRQQPLFHPSSHSSFDPSRPLAESATRSPYQFGPTQAHSDYSLSSMNAVNRERDYREPGPDRHSDTWNEMQSRGLLLVGLSGTNAPHSRPRQATVDGGASPTVDRLGRTYSSPSLSGSTSRFEAEYLGTHAHEDDGERRRAARTVLHAPRYGAAQPNPRSSATPLAMQVDSSPGPSQWPTIYLPPTPHSTSLSCQRSPRPVRTRSISLDQSFSPASLSPSTRYPWSPSASSSPVQPGVLASAQHRRLRHPSATSLTIQPIFTLPDPVVPEGSRLPVSRPPLVVEETSSSEEPDMSSLWLSRSESSSTVNTPLTAPPDFASRFDTLDAFWPRDPQLAVTTRSLDISVDVSDQETTATQASGLPWPLMTPPTSPLWASAPCLPVPPTHLQMSPSTCGARQRRSPSSKPRARSETDSPSTEKPHVCPYPGCERAFKRHEHLRRHERMHTKERPYQCEEFGCGLRFSRNDNLLQHQKTHARNGKTKKAVAKKLAEVEAARAARLGFTHTFVSEQY